MCHIKIQFAIERSNILGEFNEFDFEEYIWSIHKTIDFGVNVAKFDNGKYVYAPYVPVPIDDTALVTHRNNISSIIADIYGMQVVRPETAYVA